MALQLIYLGVLALAGLRVWWHVGNLYQWYERMCDPEAPGDKLGKRMLWSTIMRPALVAHGDFMLVISMTAVTLGAWVPNIATFVVGLGFRFAPGFFTGQLVEHLMPTPDYDAPIGPAPDPSPHLRNPDDLERWLQE